jgi:ferritin-like metal-binding protein YciE
MSRQVSDMPMQSPTDLFVHELSEVHSTERIVLEMLRRAGPLVHDGELRRAIEHHAQETRQHIASVEGIFQTLGAQPHPVQSHAAEGLHQSLQEALSAHPSDLVLDGVIAGAASKTEYFEVASYNLLVQMARAMGHGDIAEALQHNLEQENAMRQRVDGIYYELTHRMTGAPAQERYGSAETTPER